MTVPERWVVEPSNGADYDEDEEGNGRKFGGKLKRSKTYNSAKTLNDREQRKLKLKLSVYEKEMKSLTHKIDVEQKALRQELTTINPDLQKDPNAGFFVPRGTTKEQEERLREHRRLSSHSPTRSISLKEFDKMRKQRSEAARKTIERNKLGVIEEESNGNEASVTEARKRGRRGALFQPEMKAVSFTTMAKVAGLAARNSVSGGLTEGEKHKVEKAQQKKEQNKTGK
ncbi:hypothetical protein HOLleu_15166 [Holothuria leucospilota]|uniref:Uncharacterized protein n=1 Tax=Holothuria leucospilota TaxID=206669 RepID=A0A9Q1HCA0_HOLLE|nr:hypothetical protein HOLleu_15166 [Holothuria leucospilota]